MSTRSGTVHSGATTVSNQCFKYDGLRQLTEAWTITTSFCGAPSQGIISGPESYWTTYAYNSVGNRTTEVRHASAGNTTRTYTYPTPGGTRPHALTSVAITGASTGTDSYTYDAAGNTLTRNLAGKPGQTLTWDPEGRLATVVDTSGTASYTYTADGARLIGRDANGTTTAYLQGQELKTTGGTPTCTRFYGDTAVRTPAGLTWMAPDIHGTGELAVTATTLATTRRRLDPYGNPRATTPPAWVTTRGFVNGTADPTTLTHLGAREYEPNTGRFISVDPILNTADPQQTNGYSYANNNPVTFSDPTGLCTFSDGDFCISGPGKFQITTDGTARDISGGRPVNQQQCGPFASGYRCADIGPGSGPGPGPGRGSGAAPKQAKNNADVARARQIKQTKIMDVLIRAGGQILVDLIGVTDAVNCFTKADLLGCFNTALNFLPINKVFQVAKAIPAIARVTRIVIKFVQQRKWADKVLETADDVPVTCHSFDPRTKVLMGDGTTKPIGHIRKGDKVIAKDPATGITSVQVVTKTHINLDTDLTDVTVADPSGTPAVLHTTTNHPFWNQTTNQWTDAANLRVNDMLADLNGRPVTVLGINTHVGAETMRDLTVNQIHTYYVIAGNTPVLVHNVGESCSISMDKAVELGAAHVGGAGRMGVSGSGGYQFINSSVDESGNLITKIARFDINPASPHVREAGPHLNLETQVNGVPVRSGSLADPHPAIDAGTIRPGDIP